MKKLLSLSASKIYMTCGLGLLMTLGAFWHYQMNQTHLDRMNVLGQGVGTCFNRISQTFTALMIKDIQSPYLNRGFMGLSDECLNETIKGINPFRKEVGKGYETLNQLISEVHWFHEKALKIHSPLLANPTATPQLAPVSERYSKMESYKVSLMDEIDAAVTQLRSIQMNDEVLMGAGLIIFVLALSLLSLQEFNRLQLQREVEREALNFLNSGNANVGAIVDELVDRALTIQGLPVTAQIFRDYHGDLLERMATKSFVAAPPKTSEKVTTEEEITEAPDLNVNRTSIKEILVSIQNIQPKDSIQMSDVRDVQLDVPYESFEQMMNAAVNQLAGRRQGNKKIMISNQIHSDKSVVNLFVGGNTFSASELEFASSNGQNITDGLDMNLIILKEMVEESGAQWHIENKADRNGNITGMNIRFTLNRSPKDNKSKNLVSVIKGKKKDLTREMMN